MTESSNTLFQYFKVLEGPYENKKPCLPDKELIIEIPQNLPSGTLYSIGLQQEDDKPVGDKLNTISQKLNNIIEINSLLLLKQIPELLQNIIKIQQILEHNLESKAKIEKVEPFRIKPLKIQPPIKW